MWVDMRGKWGQNQSMMCLTKIVALIVGKDLKSLVKYMSILLAL